MAEFSTYPSGTVTDSQYLYTSLGSFWTQIFKEQKTLNGYTVAMAEEIIQRYLDLTEIIHSYSVKDVPVFHKQRWQPLIMYKSKFDQQPFVFEQNSAVFGAQPQADAFYQSQTFQFGEPKVPLNDVYIYFLGDTIAQFSVLADRILSPSKVFVYGTDVMIKDQSLYFNYNIFTDPNLTAVSLIGDNGVPVTYTDSKGNIIQDEMLILWIYNAEIDQQNLFYNFGYIFNLNLTNTQFFKDVLKAVFNLYIEGPTVSCIKSICSAFLGVPVVKNITETVEQIFSDDTYTYVVTDMEAYRFKNYFTLDSSIVVDAVLTSGALLISDIEYFDNTIAGPTEYYTPMLSSTGWWLREGVLDSKLALSKYLFNGPYSHQLLFSTELDVITLNSNGDLVFPVEGDPADIVIFNQYINQTANKAAIKTALGLSSPGDSYPIVPVNFVMDNFLKNNTAYIKLLFVEEDDQTQVLSLLPILKEYLPPYVYVIVKLTVTVANEIYDNLNDSITITFTDGPVELNSDGSDDDGTIESLDPYGYRDVKERLFELARALATGSLLYEFVGPSSSEVTAIDADAVSEGRFLKVTDGGVLNEIPDNATTATYRNLLLLDFTS